MQMSSHQGSMDEVDSASPSGLPHPFAGWSKSIPKKTRMITVLTWKNWPLNTARPREDHGSRLYGVVIHGANGYLPCELLPAVLIKEPMPTARLKGRAKFLLDLVKLTREKPRLILPFNETDGSDR